MSQRKQFQNVWEALEDDPIRAENLKLRSKLMMEINKYINNHKLKQTEAAKLLRITQPRVNALMQGKINEFRLDSLVNMAHRIGLHITLRIAA